jgi:cytoskeleton protein RodZ
MGMEQKSDTEGFSRQLNEAIPDLKGIREAKGLSLREISRQTRIRMYFLEAIEKGEFHCLPEPIYAKPFISIYSRILGVDDKLLLARYEECVAISGAKKPEKHFTEEQRTQSFAYSEAGDWLKRHSMTIIWLLMAITVVIIGILLSSDKPEITSPASPILLDKEKTPETAPSPLTAATEPEKKTTETAAPAAGQEAPSTDSQAGHVPEAAKENTEGLPYEITIEAMEASWVRLTEDSNKSRQTLLNPGEKMTGRAKEKFKIDIGNAGGVKIDFQGKTLESIGKRGEVIHLALPEEKKIR